MNVLITSAGRRVSLVRAFRKELWEVNKDGRLFTADAQPATSAACTISDKAFKVPFVSDPNYMDTLLSLCQENEISLVIPTIDTELQILALNRERFQKIGVHILVSSHDFVEKCRDKRHIHTFFESKGIPVAKEYEKNNYELPMFIKPSDGSRSVGAALIRDEDELKEEHFSNPKMMFLEYLDHDTYDEYTCDLYYDRNHILRCAVPRKRIEVRDGEVNKGLTVKNELVGKIREKLEKIDGAVGCLTAQFFMNRKGDKIYGIEINPRFGGGYPLSYLAGANFPQWIINEYLMNGEMDDMFDCWESDLLMLRYDDEILVHGFKG